MTYNSLSSHQVEATLDDTLVKLHAESQAGHMISLRAIKTWMR